MAFQLDACRTKITLERDYDNPKSLQNIYIKVIHPTLGDIGFLSAIRILRDFCVGRFHEVTDKNSQELQSFGWELFDRFGRVRSWLLEECNRRGTGCWGMELNSGALIHIMNISVEKQKYEHKGVGSWLIEKLLKSEHVKNIDNITCWPCPVGVRDKAEWTALQNKQISFFRKNGFRRIGRTYFFGYSLDPSHPCHALTATADANAKDHGFDTVETDTAETDTLVLRFPVQSDIIIVLSPDVSAILEAYHAKDPSSIHTPDSAGFTPIYVACARSNIFAVRTLLRLGVADDLLNANNKEGMTPLEKVETSSTAMRDFQQAMTGSWDGHSDGLLTCEFLLKRALGLPTVYDTEEKYVKMRKWGCTCGACAGGWLSPRMRFRLECKAASMKDTMPLMMYLNFLQGEPVDFSESVPDPACDFLPPRLHKAVLKTFYRGYLSIFEVIDEFLSHSPSDIPLTVAAIAQLASTREGVSFYLSKGGKYEYALDAVTFIIEEQSDLGDGTFEEEWAEDAEYNGLPLCVNDMDFAMVRRLVGLDPTMLWGPYIERGEVRLGGLSEEKDEDEYDSEDEGEDGSEGEDFNTIVQGELRKFMEQLRTEALFLSSLCP
ncbi:hypothetical protein Hypma_002762 [Hypsizygus marmoreus]|uniref:Uncharacterized protein n=1 Tax=Hypsizygus marmoreus TaxID=39966 RepID=A0A369J586_HYPMA|nr:hypothetical protein Hypma_002762 [Hypsizygus marmoreus]